MSNKPEDHGCFYLRPMEAGRILLASVQRFYSQSVLVDVRITSHNATVLSCHKTILATFSTYFESLLIGTDGPAILSLDSVSPEHTKQLSNIILFMYGHTVQVNLSDARILLEAANLFGVNALVKTLQSQMGKKDLNPSTIITAKSTGIGPLLLVTFQRFKREGKFIDAKICISPTQYFSCHKIILASFSSYFESLLLKTEACAVMDLEAVDPLYVRQLECIMDYMYGKSVKLNDRQVDTLCEAAKVFGIHSLESGELHRLKEKAVKYRQNKLLQLATQKGTINAPKDSEKSQSSQISDTSNQNEDILRKAWTLSRTTNADPPNNKMTVKILKITSDCAPISVVPNSFAPNLVVPNSSFLSAPNLVPLASFNSDHSAYSSSLADNDASIACPSVDYASLSATTSINLMEDQTSYDMPFLDALCNFDQCSNSMLAVSCSSSLNSPPPIPFPLPLTSICSPPSTSFSTPTHSSPPPAVFATSPPLSPPGFVGFQQEISGVQKEEIQMEIGGNEKKAGNTTKYLCSTCGKLFRSKRSLSSHQISQHKMEDNDALLSIPNTVNDLEIEAEGNEFVIASISGNKDNPKKCASSCTKCPHCDFVSNESSVLYDHVFNTHTVYSTANHLCEFCLNSFVTRINLMKHLKNVHKIQLFKCTECPKHFTSIVGLRNHAQNHSGTEIACQFCDYRTTNKQNLRYHEAAQHSFSTSLNKAKRVFKCTQCTNVYPFKSLLERHFKSKHNKERPFKCTMCEHSCTEKGALLTHIRCKHTNEKPFKCKHCCDKFPTSSLLARHVRRNHETRINISKPHMCKKCGKRFLDKRDLDVHVNRDHKKIKPFVCSVCLVDFTRKDHLLTHTRKLHGS